MVIKCPNCGSTAQVEIVGREATYSADIAMIHYDCKCGCGTTFTYSECYNEFLKTTKKRYSNIKQGD